MANSALKNRTPVGTAIDKELFEKLKNYSVQSGIPMSRLLDRAVVLLLNELEKN